MRQYLTFELDGKAYGVGVEFVNSVLDPQDITPLPRAATIVTGLTNVRGNVVPVFDPRGILAQTLVDEDMVPQGQDVQEGLDVAESEDGGIIIFEIENGTLLPFIGLEADRIGKVILLEEGQLAAVPDFLPDAAARYFEGFCFVGGRRHSMLRLSALASRESLFPQEGGRRA